MDKTELAALLAQLGWDVPEFAKATGRGFHACVNLIRGTAAIDPELAAWLHRLVAAYKLVDDAERAAFSTQVPLMRVRLILEHPPKLKRAVL